MATEERTERVERLKQRDDVKQALRRTTPSAEKPKVVCETRDRLRIGAYVTLVIAAVAIYAFARFGAFALRPGLVEWIERGAIGLGLIAAVFVASKLVEVYGIGRVDDVGSRFNLRRLASLVAWLIAVFIGISVLFENWYTAVVSFGLISIILGFALQTPIMSLIGWVYIITREPYAVGDRVRIGELTGDVIDVSYLDTTLWEFGGEYLSTDHPSGRLIKFPNATVLETAVINYSWPLFPYIWNEIKFNIAYQADLDLVAATVQRIVEEELGEEMMTRVADYRELLADTAIDELEVRERPAVFFRVSENTWIEVIVRYLVEPKRAGQVKSRLVPKLLATLNESPDAVMFPKLDMR